MESGEFYWNTGIFLCNVKYMIGCLQEILPNVMRKIDVEDVHLSHEEEIEFVQANFRSYPNISIEHGILEKSDQVFVMRGDFGWADLGTWHSTYEALSRSNDDNVVIDSDVMIEDSRNNIIKLPKGRLGVISGLDGFIVAEKDNVLFICKKGDSSALVRKYLNEVQMKKGEEFI
jgi:mannose-1-phosphate guanylyltransferase